MGGAIHFNPAWEGTCNIQNSIIWRNYGLTNEEEPPLLTIVPIYHIESETNTLNVCNSNVQLGWPGCDNTNKDEDPLFVHWPDDVRLVCGSPCINAGDDDFAPNDTHDVDESGSISGKAPDRDLMPRLVSTVDMGAYEVAQINLACLADIVPSGIIDVDDLLAVINGWGPCGVSCPADIAGSAPCGPNGVVDVDDLVVILNSWGVDNCNTMSTQDVGSLSSVQDCMDRASLTFTPHSPQWNNAVNRCVDGLCRANIIECD